MEGTKNNSSRPWGSTSLSSSSLAPRTDDHEQKCYLMSANLLYSEPLGPSSVRFGYKLTVAKQQVLPSMGISTAHHLSESASQGLAEG